MKMETSEELCTRNDGWVRGCYGQHFCELISLFRGHLKSSHIADKRKNFHMALYPLPPSSNESVIDNGRNAWQMAMHGRWPNGEMHGRWPCTLSSFFPTTCSNNVVCLSQGRFPGGLVSIAKGTWRQSRTVEQKYDFYFSFFFCMLKSGWPV